jgi:hypothetical protein
MDRRDFLKSSLLTCGALTLSGQVVAPNEKALGRLHVQYIREKIPSFEIPPYRGQRYEDRIPETLDIAERAKLAINGVTSISDPEADCEVYWLANFLRNPPVLVHDFNDWVQLAEGLQEVLPLLRNATGEESNSHVDPVWMTVLLKCLGADGLVYTPLKGRPWSRMFLSAEELNPVWRPDGSTTHASDESIRQISSGSLPARTIATMTVYYLRDKNPMWKQAAERMIQRVSELAIHKQDYAYLGGAWEPNAKVGSQTAPAHTLALETTGRMIQGLSQYYKATGHEPAIELAGKFNRFFRDHSHYYGSQAEFLAGTGLDDFRARYGGKGMRLGGHGHGHTIGLLSMLEYATAANDRMTLDLVKAGFVWAKSQNQTFGVSSLVGWFPEWYMPTFPRCESCTVGDMLGLAVKLSEARAGDYWDDVDRWVRNHFAEAQVTGVEWVHQMANNSPHKPVAFNESGERVPERNLGAWSGWARPNDWIVVPANESGAYGDVVGIQHCCTGNSPRGLYYVWEHMIERKDDALWLNLLLNRASRFADVYSYIPYHGRVDLKVKESCLSLKVRAPEWVAYDHPQLIAKVNGSPRSLHWEGRYVNLGAAKPGDVASVTFPIAERTVNERIGPESYTLIIKGNTVVSIDPVGQNGPFYQNRGKYRKEGVQWRQVKRFLPEEQITW